MLAVNSVLVLVYQSQESTNFKWRSRLKHIHAYLRQAIGNIVLGKYCIRQNVLVYLFSLFRVKPAGPKRHGVEVDLSLKVF